MPLHQIINNCLIFYYTFIAQKEANCSLYQAILHLYYCCSQVNSFLQCFLLSLAKLVSQKFCCCTRQLFGNLRLIGFFIVNTQYNGSRAITIMHYYCYCLRFTVNFIVLYHRYQGIVFFTVQCTFSLIHNILELF